MQTITPNAVVLRPIADLDPRTLLDDGALIEANRNAYPVVAQRAARGDGMGMAAGVGVALLLGGVTFWSMSGQRNGVAPPVPAPQVVAPAEPPAPMPVIPPQAVTTIPQPAPPPAPVLAAPPQAGVQRTDPTAAPTVVFDASTPPAAEGTPDGKAEKPPAAAGTGGGDNDEFASRIGGGAGSGPAKAAAMSSPATTITQGTLIAAILETAIDTDLPGYVRAVVSRDVRSFDGSQVLVPRSSRLIGQYKSGLAAGQTRAYVIWTRVIRPDGVSVALGSPAVEFSGQSGLAGKVDNHFFKRFGSAMLLSVVEGLSAIGTGGASLIMGGGGSAASVAAGRDGQIPPTIRVRQGEPIRVFTARDLDFSTVTR